MLDNRGLIDLQKNGILPGALNLMVLKTLSTLGALYGYGIARRLEQMGWISSKWGVSENKRRARYYSIRRAGRKQLAEEEIWRRASNIMIYFLTATEKNL